MSGESSLLRRAGGLPDEVRRDAGRRWPMQLERTPRPQHRGRAGAVGVATPAMLPRNNPPKRAAGDSYEEFHPYGTTAWVSAAGVTVSLKRYKFTGMERDEETGLQCHGVRYYVPWLGRWTSADPIGLGDGVNVFSYVRADPIQHSDITGLETGGGPLPKSPTEMIAAAILRMQGSADRNQAATAAYFGRHSVPVVAADSLSQVVGISRGVLRETAKGTTFEQEPMADAQAIGAEIIVVNRGSEIKEPLFGHTVIKAMHGDVVDAEPREVLIEEDIALTASILPHELGHYLTAKQEPGVYTDWIAANAVTGRVADPTALANTLAELDQYLYTDGYDAESALAILTTNSAYSENTKIVLGDDASRILLQAYLSGRSPIGVTAQDWGGEAARDRRGTRSVSDETLAEARNLQAEAMSFP